MWPVVVQKRRLGKVRTLSRAAWFERLRKALSTFVIVSRVHSFEISMFRVSKGLGHFRLTMNGCWAQPALSCAHPKAVVVKGEETHGAVLSS